MEQNGVCEYGEICLYYGSDATGSLSDFSSDHGIDDYGDSPTDCYKFISPGAGQGQCIKNNAESLVDNSDLDVSMHTSGPAEGHTYMTQLFGRTFGNDPGQQGLAQRRIGARHQGIDLGTTDQRRQHADGL